ncbi:MAG: EamA family transporter [Eubacteriales bacterium]
MVLILLGIVFIESSTAAAEPALVCLCADRGVRDRGSHWYGATVGETIDATVFETWRAASASVFLWLFVFLRKKQKKHLAIFHRRAWLGVLFSAVFSAAASASTHFSSLRGDMSEFAPTGILTSVFVMLFARMFQKEKQPGASLFGTLLVVPLPVWYLNGIVMRLPLRRGII